MSKQPSRHRVGEIRPSQLIATYGIGAIIDLPKLSVIVTGLEDWPLSPEYVHPIIEERLLIAVRYRLPSVKKLLAPPIVPDNGLPSDPFDSAWRTGAPVAMFPRWMVCPQCRLLAPLNAGLFRLDSDVFRPDRTVYRHENCNKGRNPEVIPARFLVACEAGHLDDFPWVAFVHQGTSCGSPLLRLFEYGASGEARDLEIKCDSCGSRRRMAEAFGPENREKLPKCRGRRPHLRDFDPDGCTHTVRPLTLGASNTWFSATLSAVAIPVESGKLSQLVNEQWAKLQAAKSLEVLKGFREIGQLGGELSGYDDADIWQAVDRRRKQAIGELPPSGQPDLKEPEWQIFTHFDPDLNSDDFRLQPVEAPRMFNSVIQQVVLVERLREVAAMVGFTRIDAIGELNDPELSIQLELAPLSRQNPTWVPANEVRGEGIFIQFDEDAISQWLAQPSVMAQEMAFFEAHQKWRKMRRLEPADRGFPGIRYVLLHTFSHALMRQLALECGYTSASIRERIYARPANHPNGAMAGILIYTSAPDSEGTLGGLVSLGQPETLGRHMAQALESARLCASDPLCAERPPSQTGQTLHAAACHACVFVPETSCERGNRYLDRSTLVKTVEREDLAYFGQR